MKGYGRKGRVWVSFIIHLWGETGWLVITTLYQEVHVEYEVFCAIVDIETQILYDVKNQGFPYNFFRLLPRVRSNIAACLTTAKKCKHCNYFSLALRTTVFTLTEDNQITKTCQPRISTKTTSTIGKLCTFSKEKSMNLSVAESYVLLYIATTT